MANIRIKRNKELFIHNFNEYVTRITKDEKEKIIRRFENSDLFTAPASRFHHPEEYVEQLNKASELVFGRGIKFESLVIVSLLHGLYNVGRFEPYSKSVFKGTDEFGKKIFEDETSYRLSDNEFIFGDEGTNTVYLIQEFLKLTYQEALAINNHKGFYENGNSIASASKAWAKSNLALFLHLADMMATFYDDPRYN